MGFKHPGWAGWVNVRFSARSMNVVKIADKKARWVNVNDRGRPIGESHWRARFSDHEVELMVELVEVHGLTCAEVARKFECSKSYVAQLVRGDYRGQAIARTVKR